MAPINIVKQRTQKLRFIRVPPVSQFVMWEKKNPTLGSHETQPSNRENYAADHLNLHYRGGTRGVKFLLNFNLLLLDPSDLLLNCGIEFLDPVVVLLLNFTLFRA